MTRSSKRRQRILNRTLARSTFSMLELNINDKTDKVIETFISKKELCNVEMYVYVVRDIKLLLKGELKE